MNAHRFPNCKIGLTLRDLNKCQAVVGLLKQQGKHAKHLHLFEGAWVGSPVTDLALLISAFPLVWGGLSSVTFFLTSIRLIASWILVAAFAQSMSRHLMVPPH